MKPGSFVGALEALAGECPDTAHPETAEDWERLIAATSRIVLWEFEGITGASSVLDEWAARRPGRVARRRRYSRILRRRWEAR